MMEELEQEVIEIEESFRRSAMELHRELEPGNPETAGSALNEFGEAEDLNAIRERINQLIELVLARLANLRGQLRESDGTQVNNEILALQALLTRLLDLANQVDMKISLMTARQVQQNPGFAQIGQRIKDKLKVVINWLKSICGRLWQLLSRLMTPKEWKLSGKVGTGVFNLADVGIEITFG